MLDIKFIRDNPDLVAKTAKAKGYEVNVDQLLKQIDQRLALVRQRDELRSQRNTNSFVEITGKTQKIDLEPEQITKGKAIKQELAKIEDQLTELNKSVDEQLRAVPNVFPDDTPLGGEESNREEKKWGDVAPKDFKIIDHLTWGEQRGLIDFERGAKVAGAKFYFLKGELAELELAVFQLGLKLAKQNGFTPMTVPHLVNTRTLEGAGFSARGQEKQIYKIEDDDLNLIATAEIPITGYYADEILDEKNLPIMYAGLSPAYRVEGGAYGKHNKGLFRTHQFNKLELYAFCKPENSEELHQKLIGMEEEFCQLLEIPYRLVRIAAGDLGAPAYKKFDIEYWSPVDQTYRELMSCSNVTDYQARRLNIKYRAADGSKLFVHTLNGTLAAMSRITIALIENHQTKSGELNLPEVLKP